MRLLTVGLGLFLLIVQYPLWVGPGSLADVYNLKQQYQVQQRELTIQQQKNRALEAEIQNLKQQADAVEARARYQLGLVRKGEIYYQLIRQR